MYVGAGLGMVGAVLVIVACALPYIHYTDSTSPASQSIFNTGYGPAIWFAAEPVGVSLLALAASVVLLAPLSRLQHAVASGVLMAFGAQTFLLFLGFIGFAAVSSAAQMGPGGIVGAIGSSLLFAGGLAGVVSRPARPARPTA